MSCAAGPENWSQHCVGIGPNVQGYRCNYCWGVIERYSRTKQTIAARRLSVSNMLDVKKAHDIQRGMVTPGADHCPRFIHRNVKPTLG